MNILFLGHSLIEFFDWQSRFPEHRVANLGVAGESVEGLLARMDRIIANYPVADLVFLMTGLNNLAMEDYGFFDNYRRIIEKLRRTYPAARICMHSILPVRIEFIANESIEQANRTLGSLAVASGAEFLDIYDLFIDAAGQPVEPLFAEDGVHLSVEGYRVWTDFLATII